MARCGTCRKSKVFGCRCGENKITPVKEKVRVKGADGRSRTVTRNSNVGTDARGIEWCRTCSCRVMSGLCSNVTCSTRRGDR